MMNVDYNSSSFPVNDILFTLEGFIEDLKMELYVNEGILLAEGYHTVPEVALIHEAFKEKMKIAFDKLMAAIGKLWAKFVEKTTALLKNDEGYLDKYKDIILRKPLKEESYTMYPYWKGSRKLESSKIPAFNFNSVIKYLGSEEEFIGKYFSEFSKDSKMDFAEVAKVKFRGANEPQKIAGNAINMTDMFNFCKDYKNKTAMLEKDMKEIENAGNHAIKLLSQIKTESVDPITGDSSIYSFVHERYIHEIELVQKSGNKADEDKNKSSNVAGENKKDEKKEDLKSSPETSNQHIDGVKTYIRVCYKFLGAKLTVLEEMYKAYMFIIRDHVKSYSGDKVTKDDPDATPAEDADAKKAEKDSGKKGMKYTITKIANKVTGKDKAKNESMEYDDDDDIGDDELEGEDDFLDDDDIDEDFIITQDDEDDAIFNMPDDYDDCIINEE